MSIPSISLSPKGHSSMQSQSLRNYSSHECRRPDHIQLQSGAELDVARHHRKPAVSVALLLPCSSASAQPPWGTIARSTASWEYGNGNLWLPVSMRSSGPISSPPQRSSSSLMRPQMPAHTRTWYQWSANVVCVSDPLKLMKASYSYPVVIRVVDGTDIEDEGSIWGWWWAGVAVTDEEPPEIWRLPFLSWRKQGKAAEKKDILLLFGVTSAFATDKWFLATTLFYCIKCPIFSWTVISLWATHLKVHEFSC